MFSTDVNSIIITVSYHYSVFVICLSSKTIVRLAQPSRPRPGGGQGDPAYSRPRGRKRNRIGPPGNRVARFRTRLNTFRRLPPRHSYGYDSPNHARQIVPLPNSMVQITGSIAWSRSPSGTPPPARDPRKQSAARLPTAGSRIPCRTRNAPRKKSCRHR